MRTRFVPLIAFSLAALLAVAGTTIAQSEDPNPEAPQWLDARYEVTLDEGMQELVLDGDVDLHKAQTDNRMLQRQCDGSTCSADDIREAYQRAGESGKQQIVAGIEATVEDRIDAALSSMATGGAEPTSQATVDEASLAEPTEGSEYQPPIPITAEGSVALGLLDGTGITAEQGQALFRMGATVDQVIEQEVQAGTNLTLTLAVTSPMGVLEASDGTVSPDGTQIAWTEKNWDSADASLIEDEVTIGDPSVEVPTETDAGVEVTLDISDVSVRYGSMFGDDAPADAQVSVAVDGEFGAIENPRDVERVQLDYLSADAVRIALEHDLLEDRQLIALEDRAREQIRGTLESMTGETVEVSGGFTAGDLSPQAVGEPAGTGDPISLNLNASAQVAFPPEQPPDAAAQGFTVTTLSMGSFELPTIDTPYDVDTSITLVLPTGLDLDFETPAGYTVEEGTQDGRQAYTFSSTGEEQASGGQEATIQDANIVVNHPFVWNVFWPVLVFLALLLIVLPAVVIGLTIRRRRKRGPPTAGESSQPVSGSQASQRSKPGEGE